MYGHAHLMVDLCHGRPRVFLSAAGEPVCARCVTAELEGARP